MLAHTAPFHRYHGYLVHPGFLATSAAPPSEARPSAQLPGIPCHQLSVRLDLPLLCCNDAKNSPLQLEAWPFADSANGPRISGRLEPFRVLRQHSSINTGFIAPPRCARPPGYWFSPSSWTLGSPTRNLPDLLAFAITPRC